MPYHKVENPGEWMGSIAADAGFKEWQWIWKLGQNASLRSARDPSLLSPGDVVYVPKVEPKEVAKATDADHLFEVEHDKDKLIIRFNGVDIYTQNFGPIPFTLTIGGVANPGAIAAENDKIEVPLPIATKEATLEIGGITRTLMVGALHRIERLSGMQARINNQGFFDGPVDNANGPLTKQGVTGFQEYYNLKVDGDIGSETRGKMKTIYGS